MTKKLNETDLLQKNPEAADIFLKNKEKLASATGSARPQKRELAPPFERAQRSAASPVRTVDPMLAKVAYHGR